MGDEIGGKRRQTIVMTFRPTIFDGYVSSFDIAYLIEPLTECGYLIRSAVGRCAVEEADHRHCGLLRLRPERPRRRPAEQRDECAPGAVGTRVTSCPPLRSVHAAFPHTAPTSGV